jgi:Leucine-rich repeat (LRR) protein
MLLFKRWKNLIISCLLFGSLSGCDEMDTSPSSQAEAANQLRKIGVSVVPDDNGVIWSLIINQSDFENDDCKYIRAFPKLKYLSLADTSIDDQGMRYLKGLVSLEKIYLSNTKITDQGIESLEGLEHLMILDLSNTSVTDKSFNILKKLPSLEHLKILETSVTEEGVRLFRKSKPDCEVEDK